MALQKKLLPELISWNEVAAVSYALAAAVVRPRNSFVLLLCLAARLRQKPIISWIFAASEESLRLRTRSKIFLWDSTASIHLYPLANSFASSRSDSQSRHWADDNPNSHYRMTEHQAYKLLFSTSVTSPGDLYADNQASSNSFVTEGIPHSNSLIFLGIIFAAGVA
jgi:hypothetical protein